MGILILAIMLISISFISLNIGSTGAITGNSTTTRAEATELEGTWHGNETTTENDTSIWIWTFSNNTVEFGYLNEFGFLDKENESYKGDITLDTTKSPKHLDITITNNSYDESFNGEVSLGLYELKGKSLTVLLNDPGNLTRPTSFAAGSGRTWDLVFGMPDNGSSDDNKTEIFFNKAYQDYFNDVIKDFDGENPKATNEFPGLDIIYIEINDTIEGVIKAQMVLAGPPLDLGTYKIVLYDTENLNSVIGIYSLQWGNKIVFEDSEVTSGISAEDVTITWLINKKSITLDSEKYDIEATSNFTSSEDIEYVDKCDVTVSTEVPVGTGPPENGNISDGNGDGGDGDGDGDGNGDGNDTKKDKDKDKGFLPGFELTVIMVVLMIIAIISRRRRK